MKNHTKIFIFLLLLAFTLSCKHKQEEPVSSPNEFLKGTWAYPNGAELYYDGTSTTAKGTKVPTNNIFGFVVGEDYWQDLNSIGNDKWTVMQILRSTAGTKFYSPTTITKLSATSIEIDISGFGKEILTKK